MHAPAGDALNCLQPLIGRGAVGYPAGHVLPGDGALVGNRGHGAFETHSQLPALRKIKTGHCVIQNRPLGVETGQYPKLRLIARLSSVSSEE
ncbi:hypothetical protein [Rhodoplanes sp. Z2-YC6860]|uniref:hypothetical protein n=1 Tax=Rhodoplanes sp. Z2-YC6860 TaxID=674703 RepID=UPI0012EE1A42|nr:hypothetical protein [Rhodoplanes sp. Z2-YC6860]